MVAYRRVARVGQCPAGDLTTEQAPSYRMRPCAVGAWGNDRVGAGDHLSERARIPGLECGEILLDLRRELGIAHRRIELALGVEQPLGQPHVHDGGAGRAHRGDRRLHHPVHFPIEPHEVTCHTDTRPLECPRVEVPGVVGLGPAFASPGHRIGGINTGEDTERHGDVAHMARHRSACIEAERQRNDAVTAEQAEGGLEPHDAIHRGRSADRPACVGAKAKGGESGSDGRPGASR